MRRLPLKIIILLGDSSVFYQEYKKLNSKFFAFHDQMNLLTPENYSLLYTLYFGGFPRFFPSITEEHFRLKTENKLLNLCVHDSKIYLATHFMYFISVSEVHPS